MTGRACQHYEQGTGRVCGATVDVRAYLAGPRCPQHTPARLAGRPEDAPDPARTLTGLRAAMLERLAQDAPA